MVPRTDGVLACDGRAAPVERPRRGPTHPASADPLGPAETRSARTFQRHVPVKAETPFLTLEAPPEVRTDRHEQARRRRRAAGCARIGQIAAPPRTWGRRDSTLVDRALDLAGKGPRAFASSAALLPLPQVFPGGVTVRWSREGREGIHTGAQGGGSRMARVREEAAD